MPQILRKFAPCLKGWSHFLGFFIKFSGFHSVCPGSLNVKVHSGNTMGWAQNVREGGPRGVGGSQFSISEATRLPTPDHSPWSRWPHPSQRAWGRRGLRWRSAAACTCPWPCGVQTGISGLRPLWRKRGLPTGREPGCHTHQKPVQSKCTIIHLEGLKVKESAYSMPFRKPRNSGHRKAVPA